MFDMINSSLLQNTCIVCAYKILRLRTVPDTSFSVDSPVSTLYGKIQQPNFTGTVGHLST